MSFEDHRRFDSMTPEKSAVHPGMVVTMRAIEVASAALDSEQEGIRLAAAQTILRYSQFVRPNDASQVDP
jgi:hypothetical protein